MVDISHDRQNSDGGVPLSSRGVRGHMDNFVLTYITPIGGLLDRHGCWTEDNTDGALILSIAENRLSMAPVAERLAVPIRLTEDDMVYPDNTGALALRKAFAKYLEHTFMQGVSVDAGHLALLAGAGSVVDLLCFALMDAGDAVLVPAPYYPAFDNDLMVRNEVVPIPVHLRSDTGQSFEDQLDSACISAVLSGRRVKGLLLCQPDNPTGQLYSRQRMVEMLQWAAKRQVHFISDEVYANSVFEEGAEMVSATQALQDLSQDHQLNLVNYLHVIYGLSKDWCAGGLRVGGLWSRNEHLRSVIMNLGYFTCISSLTSRAVTDMLSDLDFVDSYLEEMRLTLRAAYTYMAEALKGMGVGFTPASAGIFMWLDLRSLLSDSSWEAEDALWHSLIDECAILLTPGKTCHGGEPGFFRICYASVPLKGVREAAKRLAVFVQKKKAPTADVNPEVAHTVTDTNGAVGADGFAPETCA